MSRRDSTEVSLYHKNIVHFTNIHAPSVYLNPNPLCAYYIIALLTTIPTRAVFYARILINCQITVSKYVNILKFEAHSLPSILLL